jgi:hypothetical protein
MALHEASIELTDDAKEMLVEKGYDGDGCPAAAPRDPAPYQDLLADFVLGAELTRARRS